MKRGGATVEAVVESSKNPFINFFFSIFCFFLSPIIFLKGIKSYLNIFFSSTKIIHESFINEIKEFNGKKIITIEKKDSKKIKFNDIDVVSLNYGFYPNNDIGKLLGLDGQFNKKKNYFEIKKNIFNQTSDKNIFFIGEAARNAGAKISLYEGQLTGLYLSENFKSIFGILKLPFLFLNLLRSNLFQKFLWLIFSRNHLNIAAIKDETILCRCEDVR